MSRVLAWRKVLQASSSRDVNAVALTSLEYSTNLYGFLNGQGLNYLGRHMKPPLTPPKVLFDELFGQLLGWVTKREELKATMGLSLDLIDANDRLHSLRSQLATPRCMLTDETGIQVCSHQPADQADAAYSASQSVKDPSQHFDIGLN